MVSIAYFGRRWDGAGRRLVKGWPDRILLRGIGQQGEQSAEQRTAGASAKRQQWIQSGAGGRHRRLLRFPIQQGCNGRQINDVVAYCDSSPRGAPDLAENSKRQVLHREVRVAIGIAQPAFGLGRVSLVNCRGRHRAASPFQNPPSKHHNCSEGQEFPWQRSEEHTSELQSLMRISYAVLCLTKKKQHIEL